MTNLFGFRLQASEPQATNAPLSPCSPGADSALSAKVGGPEPPTLAASPAFRCAPLAGDTRA
ncbi:MAG: hypothetical protein ACK55X_12600 [Synechococcaceae cyanobacterium]|jgi:hypothetical protein